MKFSVTGEKQLFNSPQFFGINQFNHFRGATAGKAPKSRALPRFWVSIRSYKKQPVKKIWGRILGLAWLKFAVAPLCNACYKLAKTTV